MFTHCLPKMDGTITQTTYKFVMYNKIKIVLLCFTTVQYIQLVYMYNRHEIDVLTVYCRWCCLCTYGVLRQKQCLQPCPVLSSYVRKQIFCTPVMSRLYIITYLTTLCIRRSQELTRNLPRVISEDMFFFKLYWFYLVYLLMNIHDIMLHIKLMTN